MRCSKCPMYHYWSNESDKGEACAIFGDGWDSQFQYEDKEGITVGCYLDKHYIDKANAERDEYYASMAQYFIDEDPFELDLTEDRMSDLIDRQAVIDLLKQMRKDGSMVPWEGKDVFARIRKLPTIQPEKAQLSQEDTTSDLIDRKAALDALRRCQTYLYDARDPELKLELSSAEAAINNLPTIQPVATDIDVGDTISRQAAIDGKIVIQRTNGVEIYSDEAVPVEYLKSLPTIQPEERTGKRTETHACDLISRQQAIDAADCINGVEEVLRSLPYVQPERKKGEWIEISSINHTYKCSECGRLLVNVADGRNNVSKHYPYCHCGAKMTISTK